MVKRSISLTPYYSNRATPLWSFSPGIEADSIRSVSRITQSVRCECLALLYVEIEIVFTTLWVYSRLPNSQRLATGLPSDPIVYPIRHSEREVITSYR